MVRTDGGQWGGGSSLGAAKGEAKVDELGPLVTYMRRNLHCIVIYIKGIYHPHNNSFVVIIFFSPFSSAYLPRQSTLYCCTSKSATAVLEYLHHSEPVEAMKRTGSFENRFNKREPTPNHELTHFRFL
jgi:hypothetical protein